MLARIHIKLAFNALAAILICLCATAAHAQTAEQPLRASVLLDGGQVVLPNGWKVSPAGHATKLPGDMPMRILFAPGTRELLVSTGGYNEHGISVLDPTSGELLQQSAVPRTFVGMCIDASRNRVYLSGGQTLNARDDKQGAAIRQFHIADGKLTEEPPLAIAGLNWKKSFIAGLAVHPDGSLYAANLNEDCVYRISPDYGTVLATARVGYRPCAIALSTDGKTLAVANWGGASVGLLDAKTLKEKARAITVGSHP